jgi:hypothetical protein
MPAPASQKAVDRPISFLLTDSTGAATLTTLVLRPEDLTRNEPGLLTPTQTLGGAWIDDWGRGISTIQISGHTGWNSGAGWEQEFINLRQTAWLGWHTARAAAVASGKAPDTVKLIFTDALDTISVVVAPGQFTLRRNKTRPLFMQYQIGMTVLTDLIQDQTQDPLNLSPSAQSPAGIATAALSLQLSITQLISGAALLATLIPLAAANPLAAFIGVANIAFGQTLDFVTGAGTLAGLSASQLISVSQDLAFVGQNIFWNALAVGGYADAAAFQLEVIASAFENALCIMSNAFAPWPQYPDYSAIYGASSCSSTVGGSPISATALSNTFESVIDAAVVLPAVSQNAQSEIAFLTSTDPVLAPADLGTLLTSVGIITGGISF